VAAPVKMGLAGVTEACVGVGVGLHVLPKEVGVGGLDE